MQKILLLLLVLLLFVKLHAVSQKQKKLGQEYWDTKRNFGYWISFSLNEISIPVMISLDILQLESPFFPNWFLHHREPYGDQLITYAKER